MGGMSADSTRTDARLAMRVSGAPPGAVRVIVGLAVASVVFSRLFLRGVSMHAPLAGARRTE
jgi:hypothetical protein